MSRTAFRALVLLLAGHAIPAWSLPAGVLCVADDGHVALERVADACCEPHDCEAEAGAPQCRVSRSDDGCCGPCTDIVLGAGSAPGRSLDRLLPVAPPACGPAVPAVVAPPRAEGSVLAPAAAAFVAPRLLALRTVVLTC